MNFNLLAILLTSICLFGGNLLPFGKLINIIYPSIGYIGLMLFISLVFKDLKFIFRFRTLGEDRPAIIKFPAIRTKLYENLGEKQSI